MIKPEAKETILYLLDAEIKKQTKKEELEELQKLIEAKAEILGEGSKQRAAIEKSIENIKTIPAILKANELLEGIKPDALKEDAREALLKTSINLSKEFYTIEEAAELLKVHSNTIRNNIKNGNLKAFKIGLQWRIPRRELM